MIRSKILLHLLRSGKLGNMEIDSDSLIETVARSNYPGPDDSTEIPISPSNSTDEIKPHWWEIPYIKGTRFIAIVATGLLMFTVIITSGIIYINDTLLYDNELNINNQGAFNPHKSMNCEYALYLFNTADVWANSGIQIGVGDRYRINISGALHSSVEGAIYGARNNTEQRYGWVKFENDGPKTLAKDEESTVGFCLYRYEKKKNAGEMDRIAFGAPLVGIFPESSDLASNPIIDDSDRAERVWEWTRKNGRKFEKAKYSGTLHFAINDMYFRDNAEMKMFYQNENNKNFSGFPFTQEEINARLDNPKHDFSDNLGQLMVAVEIQRHVPHAFFHPLMAYRELEYSIWGAVDNDSWSFAHRALSVLWSILCFLVRITLLFGFWVLTLLLVNYALFFVGHKVHRLWRRAWGDN